MAVFDKERETLNATLMFVDDKNSSFAAPGDSVTIKGMLAHRTHRMGMFNRCHQDGVDGRAVRVSAKGYKWNQLKAYSSEH